MSAKKRAVFFDCWDTLISFKSKTPSWNIACLEKHSINKTEIDWAQVALFTEQFFRRYFRSSNGYEIKDSQLLTLLCHNFHIKLDCSVDDCVHEVLLSLDPQPVEGIERFLSLLNEDEIYHAVLSNTIYDSDDTFKLVNKLLPENGLSFFLGSAEVGVKKPNPLFFNTGLKMSGFRPSESVYIGDSFLADVQGANLSLFSNVIWLNFSKKDVTQFSDLPTYLGLRYVEVSSYDEVINLYKEGKLWN